MASFINPFHPEHVSRRFDDLWMHRHHPCNTKPGSIPILLLLHITSVSTHYSKHCPPSINWPFNLLLARQNGKLHDRPSITCANATNQPPSPPQQISPQHRAIGSRSTSPNYNPPPHNNLLVPSPACHPHIHTTLWDNAMRHVSSPNQD